jgi:two-component system nitrogen regulation sensor histidine kinase NtrY
VDLRQQLARRSRDTRWVAAFFGALLLVLTVLYYLMQRGRDLPSALVTNRVLLFALRNLDALLILVILFVLGRNLVKLWIERRSRVVGARFKTKLVATYIGLSLVPVLVLFFYASELLQGAIDRWFSSSLSNVLEQGNAVAQALEGTIEQRNGRDARRLVAELQGLDLEDADARAAVGQRLERWRRETGAHYIGVFDEDVFVNAVLDPSSGLADLPEVGRGLPREAAQKGLAVRVLEPPGTRGRLILGAAGSSPPPGRRATVVVVGTLLDPLTSTRSAHLVEAFQTYRQVEVQKGEFRASYILMFVLVTLLILLASSWMGLFLARRLMAPLQALGEAFQRVSSGELEHRIEVPADDEMAVVIDSFHRMTDELGRSRAAIERSNLELVAANRALDDERARVATTLENLPTGVVALDRAGRVASANGAVLQMLKVRAGEIDGRTLAETFAGDPRAPLAEFFARAAREGAGGATEQLAFAVGPTWRTFEVRLTRLPAAGGAESGGWVLALEDLTELIRAQKLATWTEAARRVAHEIKNPLTPIRLAAERLHAHRDQGDSKLGELVDRSAEIIVREVDNMQALVDEFARFARMPGPSFAATRFEPLLDEVLDLYRDLKTGVPVGGSVEPEVGEVWVDPDQMRRVLINLLDNAIEATSPPGSVTVRVARRGTSGDRIEIAVADSGRGVAAEDRDKLFLPFFSRKGRGSGMGLAIVQRIVADHDGEIAVLDNQPKGAVFRITIPARGAAAAAPAARGTGRVPSG